MGRQNALNSFGLGATLEFEANVDAPQGWCRMIDTRTRKPMSWRMRLRPTLGFTIAELLVVIAVLSVIAGILLPVLRSARETAKRAQCLSQIGQLMKAAVAYSLDQRDGMWPVIPSWERDTDVEFDSWRFGGKTADATYWGRFYNGALVHQARTRPLNRYLFPDNTLHDPPDTRLELRIFECPSDYGTLQRSSAWHHDQIVIRDATISCYDDVGTSYQMNTKWFRRALEENASQPPSRRLLKRDVWRKLRPMFQQAFMVSPARMVWLSDQTLDLLAIQGQSVSGDHGGLDMSMLGFMDGHVTYQRAIPKAYETQTYILKFGSISRQ